MSRAHAIKAKPVAGSDAMASFAPSFHRRTIGNFDQSARSGAQSQALQRSLGNQAVLRMLSSAPPQIQPKLSINQPGDRYEQEADHVAEQVMRMRDPHANDRPTLASAAPQVQRACACGGSGGECESCKKKNEDGVLQRSAAAAPGRAQAPPGVHSALRSPGQPLDSSTRSFMEARFLANFGGVRVHTGAEAAGSASQISAAAYTVGQDIVFAHGRFAPGTSSGDRLIAHELTHVVQQSQPASCTVERFDNQADPEERQAEHAADTLRWGSLAPQYDKVASARTNGSSRQAERPFSHAIPSRAFIQRVQLTYDDGPDTAGNTRTVLDELNKAGARATFYLVGKRVNQGDNWRVVFDIAASGHWLGNHAFDWNDDTDNHIFLNGTPRERADKILATEIAIRTALIRGRNQAVLNNSWLSIPKANRDEIEEVIAHGTGRFRTPGFKSKSFDTDGSKTAAAIANANNVLAAAGLRPFARTMEGILGSEGVDVDPKDWQKGRTKPEIELAVHDALKKNTDSVLLHSRIAATAAATPGIVADIKDRKFTFDPTPQGAVGSITPKSGFANITISEPPTAAELKKAKEFFRAGIPSLGGNIVGGMAVRVFQLAQRVGRAEVDSFASEIRTTTVQTKDGPIPLANWMNANDEWDSFSMFFQNWNTMDTSMPAPYPTEIFFEQNRPLESQSLSDLSVLTTDGSKNLTDLANLLKGDTGLKVQFVGSCSSEGSVEENYKLGERRTRFVFAQVSIPINRLFDPAKDDLRGECHHISRGFVTCGKAGASDVPNPRQRRVLARFYR